MIIANNIADFKSLFTGRLLNMLSDDELGAYILVLANSLQDESIKQALAGKQEEHFRSLKQGLNAGTLNAAQDDLDVFMQLARLELSQLSCWQEKHSGPWRVVLNSIRKLRPARASSQIQAGIQQPFDESKFHFNKPFLKPEILWEGQYKGKKVRALYNKFPFSDFHLLLVIAPEEEKPQYLGQAMHHYVFELQQELAEIFPGFTLAYNSLAAGASVNHQHFQTCLRTDEYPLEAACWQHNGGEKAYPITVYKCNDAASGWECIHQLSDSNTAFNCLYRKPGCYIIPRKFQGLAPVQDWLRGAGWLDVAGVITVSDEGLFASLEENMITDQLGRLNIS